MCEALAKGWSPSRTTAAVVVVKAKLRLLCCSTSASYVDAGILLSHCDPVLKVCGRTAGCCTAAAAQCLLTDAHARLLNLLACYMQSRSRLLSQLGALEHRSMQLPKPWLYATAQTLFYLTAQSLALCSCPNPSSMQLSCRPLFSSSSLAFELWRQGSSYYMSVLSA
jgi:hypothetical protein